MSRLVNLFILSAALTLSVAWNGTAIAAPAFQAAGTAASGTGVVNPAWPAHQIGDIALLFVESAGGEPATLSTPAGFVAVTGSPQNTGTGTNGTRITVFWARATSTSMATPRVADAGDHVYARILTYRGVIASGNPWDVTGGGVKAAASTSVTVSGVTTTVADTLIVQAVARDNDSTAAAFSAQTNANLTGIAERSDAGTTSGNGGGFALWDGVKATAGATGNTTANVSNSINAFLSIALKPAPPTVVSINRADPDPSSAAAVSWTVTFSIGVTGVDASAFTLAESGVSGAFITAVTGGGTTWTVSANTGIGAGTLGLNQTGPGSVSPTLSGTFTGQVYTISATAALAEYRMDEASWNGTAGEVVDSSGSYPGRAVNSANTTDGSRAIAGNPGTCRYGVFDNGGSITQGYVELPGFPDLNSDFTITAWIKTTDNTVGAQRILIDDESDTGGYGLSLGEGGAGVLRFYARGSSAIILDTPLNTIANNTWYFVAGVADITNGVRRIYVYDAAGNILPGLPVSVVSNPAIAAPAPVFQAAGTAASGTGVVNPAWPAHQIGDIALLFVESAGGEPATLSTPAGFVAVTGSPQNTGTGTNGTRITVFWARATSTSMATPRVADAGDHVYARILTYRGVIASGNPWDVTGGGVKAAASTSVTVSGVTTTVADTLIVQAVARDNDSTAAAFSAQTNANLTGIAERSDAGTTSGNGGGFALWDGVKATAGATGNTTANVSNSINAFLSIALKPPAPVTDWGVDTGMASIGAETNSSSEPPATNHFKGNLDEVRVFPKVLNQAALATLATQTHACSVVAPVPDHYELSLPTNSIACLPSTVTVTACTDATSPCTNPLADVSGTTAILATSGGTLGTTPVSFGATGVASTTLSYPAAPDGTPVTITLSGEQVAASNPRQWCPDGAGCVVANSGSTTFNTAGFIFSAAAGGGVATIATQVAGASSVTNFLRAVKTNTTTQACEAALVGASSVDFGYECNNPTTCYGSNLMSVNAGAATTIARNDNGSVTSYLPVTMSFDANGNAPFTFNYSDVGQVTLWARKLAGGSLLSALSGFTNAFVVKPGGFVLSNIKQTAAPQLVNPAAANATGAKFVKAGENFTMNVSATTTPASGASVTPNFGRELAPEGVTLAPTLVAPAGGAAGTFSGNFGAFANGVATGTTFTWSEVGIISLTASVGDADYLGTGDTAGTSSGNIGRFFPDHLDTVVTPQGSPVGFAYSGNPLGPVPGLPFTVTVTARNAPGAATVNYNYAGGSGFSKDVNLSVPVGGATGQLYVDAVAGGTGAVPASKFLNGVGNVDRLVPTGKISFVFNSLPRAEQAIQIHAEDADTITSSGANGSINIRHGRLRVFNAFGSEKADLSLPLRAEYWGGNAWVPNADDGFTVVPAGAIALSAYSGTLSDPANFGAGHVAGTTLASGQGSIVLAKPSPAATGSVDLAINLGTAAVDQSCLPAHPASTGAAIPWLRSINGNCAATYDRDPSARASFGIFAPETRKTIHMRELF